jgi:hypothetical protein
MKEESGPFERSFCFNLENLGMSFRRVPSRMGYLEERSCEGCSLQVYTGVFVGKCGGGI